MTTKIAVNLQPVNRIVTRLGVRPTGDVQQQLTLNVNRRITKYMPFRSGALATKHKYIKSPTEIEVVAPYARFQYYGMVMVDTQTGSPWAKKGHIKALTDTPLTYDTTKHPQAGPFWDRRLMAAEGDVIARELQAYVNRRTHS